MRWILAIALLVAVAGITYQLLGIARDARFPISPIWQAALARSIAFDELRARILLARPACAFVSCPGARLSDSVFPEPFAWVTYNAAKRQQKTSTAAINVCRFISILPAR